VLCSRSGGLVLAGGNTIGTPGAVNQVKGTLVCGPGSASPTVIDTPLVPLDAQGNAEFSGSFSSSTAGCSPMDTAFLVRTAAGAWIGKPVPSRGGRKAAVASGPALRASPREAAPAPVD
jgi:hypothetical protein